MESSLAWRYDAANANDDGVDDGANTCHGNGDDDKDVEDEPVHGSRLWCLTLPTMVSPLSGRRKYCY